MMAVKLLQRKRARSKAEKELANSSGSARTEGLSVFVKSAGNARITRVLLEKEVSEPFGKTRNYNQHICFIKNAPRFARRSRRRRLRKNLLLLQPEINNHKQWAETKTNLAGRSAQLGLYQSICSTAR